MLNVYSIYDKKSEHYNNPTFAPTDGVVIRDLRMFLRKPGNLFSSFPEDYELRWIGVFYEDTGSVMGNDPRTVISFEDIIALDSNIHESEVPDGN